MTGAPIDYEFIKTVIMVINLFATMGVAAWTWLRGPSEANTKRLGSLENSMRRHQEDTRSRLDKIEGRLQFIPTVTELGDLRAELREVKTRQESFSREIHRATESLTRIEDFLLSDKARS